MPKPLCIQFPDAGGKIGDFYSKYVDYEKLFTFPQNDIINFASTGIAANDQFESIIDGDPVVRTYHDFRINAGHTVTTTNRCKGLYLNILGNCHIDGILSMTARGASTPGRYVLIEHDSRYIWYGKTAEIFEKRNPLASTLIASNGIANSVGNQVGKAAVNGGCGGGGDGASEYNPSGFGAAGSSFSGGSGGGARMGRGTGYAGNGGANGGPGGRAVSLQGYTTGGGAGNPGGDGGSAAVKFPNFNGAGQDGTGGLIILFVQGNLTFGTTGRIESNGSQGGYGYGGGGGSGGGAIHLFHKRVVAEPEKIVATGGLGGKYRSEQGWGGRPGCAGGDGTVNIVKI